MTPARYPVHRRDGWRVVQRVRALRTAGASSVRAAVDAFLSSLPFANPNTRRDSVSALDRVLVALGPDADLAQLSGERLAEVIERLWGQRAPATWNRNRAAITAWLTWCRHAGLACPSLPASSERRREYTDTTRALSRTTIERALSCRDVPLREKTLWRMLFETAARAGEVLALNVEDLDLDARRAPVRSKGGDTEWIYWGSGTAHLLPRLSPSRS